ncbi:hypothetical protein CFO_g3245 [Ceratocystis platani]|uniref:Uncharacterized protein n=1 Tax=Ceratocystis fimbriata f. sp. platani TaxID=88771 RepID=A0A0F8DEK6_CERFI|nr:hypothetical protein CFO_g3245 [Ceratocystis platani]
MRFFGILSLSFLLIRANAGDLEDNSYTFKNLGNGICTVTSQHSSDVSEQSDKFKINTVRKTMTVKYLNVFRNRESDPLPHFAIMAAVCRKYDLEPDDLNKVVIGAPKDYCLQEALDKYRLIHSDIEEDEMIDTTLTLPGTDSDSDSDLYADVWSDLCDCMSYGIVERMLTSNSIVGKISIKEYDNSCLMSYFIQPKKGGDE